ncbi:putative ribonuclease h protein [Fagus crenata]
MLLENAKVKELFTPSLSWNIVLIEEIFLSFEANLIAQIPLRGTQKPDRQVWGRTPNGIFSVQSAYQMLVEDLKQVESRTSSTSQRWKVLWKKLWSVQVPQKIKVFMWKACSNIFPTCTMLFDRNIGSNFSCSVCGEEAETRDHIFMECQTAITAWRANPIFLSSLHPNIEMKFGRAQDNGKQVKFPQKLFEVPQTTSGLNSKWAPPMNPNIVKVNVASVGFTNQRKIGIGMVVRNSQVEIESNNPHLTSLLNSGKSSLQKRDGF